MESHEEANGGAGGGTGGANKSSFLCRQSSSRWIPTTDQIRILRDLYYNCGVRSPSAEQIQRISARLRQFGKIEGKNVFYWFQNHKARERQKKRLTVDVTSGHSKYSNHGAVISSDLLNGRVPVLPPACTSPGLYFGNGRGGSPSFERAYLEHSLPGGINGGSTAEGYWMGADQSYYYQAQRASSYYYEPQTQIETLPLFPVRSEEDNILIRNHFSQACLDQPRPEEEERRSFRLYGGDGASLELSLYSYGRLPTTSS